MTQDMKKLIDEIVNKDEVPCPICSKLMSFDNKFCSLKCYEESKLIKADFVGSVE